MLRSYLSLPTLFIDRQTPSYLVYHVTNRCNANCKMCFNWMNLNNSSQNELSIDEIMFFSRKIGRIYYVSLGGGEPFLREDIDKIVHVFHKNNHTRFFQIATNALQPEIIENKCSTILKDHDDTVLRVTLSMDGIGEDHDRIRQFPGAFAHFKESFSRLSKLRRKFSNLEIRISTVFSKYSEDRAIDIYEWAKKHLVADIHSFPLVRGNTRELQAKDISVEQYEQLINHVESDYHCQTFKKEIFRKFLIAIYILTKRQTLIELKSPGRTFKCTALQHLLQIGPEGDVFPCECLPDTIGNLRDFNYDLRSMLRTKKSGKLKHMIRKRNCACTWECAISNSFIYDWKKWFLVLRESRRIKYSSKKHE